MKHIMVEQKKNAGRWYDNPDMSDLMFAMLSMHEDYQDRSVCLHMYDKASKKAISKVELDSENKWKPTEIVSSLEGEILYHPILTVGTTDTTMIKQMFDNILDGVDFVNGSNGTPACIVIPVLMHYNHFGVMIIKPNANRKETEVYYFNPLGTFGTYADEERAMFSYMKERYGEKVSITHNSTENWQTDGSQCGPYAIWFVQEVAQLVLDNGLTKQAIAERFANIWKWGKGNDESEKVALTVRDSQAGFLEELNTNFTIPLFLGFKKAVRNNPNWYEKLDELRFENPVLIHNRSQGIHFYGGNGEEIRTVDGVDAFEVQDETKDILLQHAATMPSVHSKPVTIDQKHSHSAGSNTAAYRIGFVLSCAAAGAVSAYAFNKRADIYILNAMASLLTDSANTAAIINNTAVGIIIGCALLAGYEAVSR